MNKREYLDHLFYEIGKQPPFFQITSAYKDKNHELKWSKWIDFISATEKQIERCNNRTILDIEVVLDIDEETQSKAEERYDNIIKKLDKDKLKYTGFFTGSKGFHIHLIFPELRKYSVSDRKKFKENFISTYKCDLAKASEKCMIAIESVPHWKTGKPKCQLLKIEGVNEVKKTTSSSETYEIFSLEEVKSTISKWLAIEDDEVIDIIFAFAVSERMAGDPLWLFLIAPPGGAKTEILRAIEGEVFYHLSDLTSKTFISGLMIGKGDERQKIQDLLPKLNKKTLIFKDFTTVLEKNKDERREIIAQLREIYDGSFAKKFGTLDEKVEYKARFGFIAGVTPIIDKHWKIMQQLGERFLKYRWDEDSDKVTRQAEKIEGLEEEMRSEIKNAVMGFLTNVKICKSVVFPKKYTEPLIEIAKFIALCRTPVSIHSSQSEFYYDYIPTPERPTRLVKQLKKLSKAIAIIRSKQEVTEDEVTSFVNLGFHTCPQDRIAILRAIDKKQHINLQGCTVGDINNEVKLPRTSVSNILKQLSMLDLVIETEIVNEWQGPVHYYKLTTKSSALYPLTFLDMTKKIRGDNGGDQK